jgi:hypothetical protein
MACAWGHRIQHHADQRVPERASGGECCAPTVMRSLPRPASYPVNPIQRSRLWAMTVSNPTQVTLPPRTRSVVASQQAPTLRIDAFCRGRSLFVAVLGGGFPHPNPPRHHRRAVSRPGVVRGSCRSLRLLHRAVESAPGFRQGFEGVFVRTSSIHQMLLRLAACARFQLRNHRGGGLRVAPGGADRPPSTT